MGGGGGGGGYDDKWIRDWTKKAEGRESDYVDTNTKQSQQIGTLYGRSDEATRRLNELGDWNQDRLNEIKDIQGIQSTFETRIGKNYSDIASLSSQFSDLEKLVNTPTTTGDVTGLDDIISNLQSQYSSADTAIGDLRGQLSDTESSIRSDTKSQLDEAIKGLGINDYLKTSDFNKRMEENLGALSDTLTGKFGEDIKALDLPGVRDAIAAAEGDIGSLTEDFAGLSSDMDWIKKLDLEGFDDRLTAQGETLRSEFGGDLTDLRDILESGRGEALADLEAQLGRDRAADIRQLKQDVESGRASDIEQLAGNLRQEYGDQIFDLSNTFDERMSTLSSDLGGDISTLFSQQGDLRGDLEGGLATLTSGLGTTSEQLSALRDSFGDYQTQAASNLGDVRSALEAEIGDLSGSLTSGLADIQTDYLDRILGSERAGATAREGLRSELTGALGSEAAAREAGLASEAAAREGLRSDLTGAIGTEAEARRTGLASEAAARQSGLATEASAREAGLQSAQAERTRLAEEASRGFQDVYKTREQAIADLSGRFGENLRAQEESLGRRIDDTSKAVDEKIGRLGSMMNYRMLGDSAGGVKMRRSKAYKSGAVNTGTGQLSRSMKLKTLNI